MSARTPLPMNFIDEIDDVRCDHWQASAGSRRQCRLGNHSGITDHANAQLMQTRGGRFTEYSLLSTRVPQCGFNVISCVLQAELIELDLHATHSSTQLQCCSFVRLGGGNDREVSVLTRQV